LRNAGCAMRVAQCGLRDALTALGGNRFPGP
jgi:hypothetical protein